MKHFVSKVALWIGLGSALAMAEGVFLGLEGDYSFGSKIKSQDSDPLKKAQFGLGIKGGYDFNVFRIYGAYIYDFKVKKQGEDADGSFSFKWNTHKFLVGADYTPTVAQDFKLVLGSYAGYSKLKDQLIANDAYSDSGSASGWVLGGRLGGEYSLDANNAIELGFKADKTFYSYKTKETNTGLYLGYTYKF